MKLRDLERHPPPADAGAQFQGYGLFETGWSAACSKRFIRNGASAGASLRTMSEATCCPSARVEDRVDVFAPPQYLELDERDA